MKRTSRLTVWTGLLTIAMLTAGCGALTQQQSPSTLRQTTLPDSVRSRQADTTLAASSALADSAKLLFADGDTLAAGDRLIRAIAMLSPEVDGFLFTDRLAAIDSLANWNMTYSRWFGGDFQEITLSEEGIAAAEPPAAVDDSLTGVDDSLAYMEIDTTEMLVETPDSLDLGPHVDVLPEIPDTLNSKVQSFIDYFAAKPKGRKAMEVWLSRAGTMIPRMQKILRSLGMPEDLAYLAMIESGLRTDARSYARAVGPWQFIYGTGKRFDLEMDWWYDERRDVEKATVAAAGYLRELYEHLGDWYLALAAYNCGEGRVNRDIRRTGTRDFWRIHKLPRQTRGYVPIFLAARRIASDPEAYGFEPPEYIDPSPRDSVLLTEPVELRALAEAMEVKYDTLLKMNTALVRWTTPPNRDSTWIYLPEGKAETFAEAYPKIPDEKKLSWVRHKVSNGESLSHIAEKYRSSMRAIMDVPANNLSNPNRIRAGHYLLIPVAPRGPVDYGQVSFDDEPDQPPGTEKSYHIVRGGDTLSEIAEKYHVGLSKLLRWNNLHRRSLIRPGQRLVVYRPKGSTKVAAGTVKKNSDGQAVYKVVPGDSPWLIADRFGLSIGELLQANGMSSKDRIHPGDELILPNVDPDSAMAKVTYYTVKGGDTLIGIADRYGISMGELLRWNNITDPDALAVGQRLIIKQGG
ncbi:LysM peptidoglycan-binding domain-containing protein [bacterium]|nr:LysM peptidoglycan-binding domain-containing protein [bacterium]